MLKPFKQAHKDDMIADLICPNPKCKLPLLRLEGLEPNPKIADYVGRPKVLECQNCFQKYHVDDNLKGFEYPGEPEKKGRRDDE